MVAEMREIRLYTNQSLEEGASVALEPAPAHHLARVLRARPGDRVILFNGSGLDWQCEISHLDKRGASLAVGPAGNPDNESPLTVHLGLCLSKGDRFDWAIQKSTELGVASITPLFSERVEVKLPPERIDKRRQHWQQTVISACEQSGRAVVPVVAEPTQLSTWAEQQSADLRLVLHHRQPGALPERPPRSVALLVGPEGGLAPADLERAATAGFQNLRLGPRVLRTETAPAAALAVLGSRWGDIAQS